MYNSWGQKIKPNILVYRGARDGNSSEFKAGVVESVKNGKPRVRWMWKASSRRIKIDGEYVWIPYVYEMSRHSSGSPSLDSLIVPDVDLEWVKHAAKVHKNLPSDIEFNTLEEYYMFIQDFAV